MILQKSINYLILNIEEYFMVNDSYYEFLSIVSTK